MARLLDATRSLADLLATSGSFDRFGRVLRGDPIQPGSQLPIRLRETFAAFGLLEAQPFLLALRLGKVPDMAGLSADPEAKQFQDDATAVTGVALITIEWLRSRMPRYPVRFKLPYTDPYSSRVAEDGFPDCRWPWTLDLRKTGLQSQTTVAPPTAHALDLDPEDVDARLQELRAAVDASDQWNAFREAESRLEEEHERTLDDLLASYRDMTRPSTIDVVEPGIYVRRMQHRHAALRAVEDAAAAHEGVVADYYRAFRLLDRLFDDIVIALTQFSLYGEPQLVDAEHGGWRRNADDYLEAVVDSGDVFVRINCLLTLDVPPDVAPQGGFFVVEGASFSFKRRGESFIGGGQLTCRQLSMM